MTTNKMFSHLIAVAILTLGFTTLNAQSFGSLGKWYRNEVEPTIKGERPLEVKPYVSVRHNGEQNLYYNPAGNGSARVSYGGVTIQTTNLAKREMQIARMLNGDTSVYYEVGAEQAEKEIRRRQWVNEPLYQPYYLHN